MSDRARLSYALVTPARDEADNLRRLAGSLLNQDALPVAWVVVDNGSTDATYDVVSSLAQAHDWIEVLSSPSARTAQPGTPIVRAVHAGLARVPRVDVVVKLDADVSMGPEYFAALLAAFESDPKLGIASGECYEEHDGKWIPTHVTGSHVRGATRAWRWECLQAVLPLDDTVPCVEDLVDELKATALGWHTGIVPGLRFCHHRRVGERDGGSAVRWRWQGRAAYYVRYRFWYLMARSAFRARRDPEALAMISGYLRAAVSREPRCMDALVTRELHRRQRLRDLPMRAREARGRRDFYDIRNKKALEEP
jgi:glycosyltransferase involved in cell wall biosynthesis